MSSANMSFGTKRQPEKTLHTCISAIHILLFKNILPTVTNQKVDNTVIHVHVLLHTVIYNVTVHTLHII